MADPLQDRLWTTNRRFPPILSSLLCPHRAPARRLPARVVRRGPGRRRSGRFVQLRKEQFLSIGFNCRVLLWAEKAARTGQGPAVHFAGVTDVSVTGTQVRAVDISVARRATAARITVVMSNSEAGSVLSHKRGTVHC